MIKMKTFEVEEISLGITGKNDRIVFKRVEDLEEARNEIDDAKGIYVKTSDGLIISLSHRLIYQKIYDGTILMCAMDGTGKEAKKL